MNGMRQETESKKRVGKPIKWILIIAMVVILVISVAAVIILSKQHQAINHMKTAAMQNDILFDNHGNYKDAQQKLAVGYSHVAGVRADGTVLAVGTSNDYGQCNVNGWKDVVSVAAADFYTVGLKSDGTVICTSECPFDLTYSSGRKNNRFDNWRDIVSIRATNRNIAGLKSDGTVVVCGNDYYFEPDDVEKWENIVYIVLESDFVAGLKSDGSVVVADDGLLQSKVKNWKDIVYIAAGYDYLVGLKKDGTVFVADDKSERQYKNWKNIVCISTEGIGIVGLNSDGTVVCNDKSQKDAVASWKNIISFPTDIHRNIYGITGIKEDGTIVTTISNLQQRVSSWKDIVSIAIGSTYIIGQKSNGEIVVTTRSHDSEPDKIVSDNLDNESNLQYKFDEDMKHTSDDVIGNEKTPVSADELKRIEEMLNTLEVNGFVSSNFFDTVEDIDLNLVFRDYNYVESHAKEIVDEYLIEADLEELYTPLFVVSTGEIKEIYKKYTGKDISDSEIKDRLNFLYLPKYDVYCNMHGDTNRITVKCANGIKESDNTYIITIDYEGGIYYDDKEIKSSVLTLKKNEDSYVFVSHIIKDAS